MSGQWLGRVNHELHSPLDDEDCAWCSEYDQICYRDRLSHCDCCATAVGIIRVDTRDDAAHLRLAQRLAEGFTDEAEWEWLDVASDVFLWLRERGQA